MRLLGRRGRTSVLERNQLLIGAVMALLVLGFTAGALLLSGGFFKDTYKVTASFTDAAGLKSGDDVRVAGLKAGKVDSVEIINGHVDVVMNVNGEVELSKDARAEISVETLLGKKTVVLYHSDEEELLADGDVIPLERTRTPVELIDLADTSVDLLEKSDAEAFETFMEEVTKITDGKRTEITTLIRGLTKVASAIEDRRAELGRLIDSLKTIGATFADKDDELVRLIDNYDVVLGNLARRTENLEALLRNTDRASHEVANLVSRNRGTINSALDGLHSTLRTVDRHQIDLAATISYLEVSVKGYQSVGYSHGTPNRWANIFVQSLGPVGIDAFLGPCGTFDQALDKLLGQDEEGQDCDGDGEEDGGGLPDILPTPTPTLPLPVHDGAAPPARGAQAPEAGAGDVGDLLDSVTGREGLADQLQAVAP